MERSKYFVEVLEAQKPKRTQITNPIENKSDALEVFEALRGVAHVRGLRTLRLVAIDAPKTECVIREASLVSDETLEKPAAPCGCKAGERCGTCAPTTGDEDTVINAPADLFRFVSHRLLLAIVSGEVDLGLLAAQEEANREADAISERGC